MRVCVKEILSEIGEERKEREKERKTPRIRKEVLICNRPHT